MNELEHILKEQKGFFEIKPKVPVEDSYSLSLVYTPGVGECCKVIEKSPQESMNLTNKANSIAVILTSKKEDSLSKIPYAEFRAYLYKKHQKKDAYPLVLDTQSTAELENIITNLTPTFSEFDIALVDESIKKELQQRLEKAGIKFFANSNISTHYEQMQDFEYNEFLNQYKNKDLTINELSVKLHEASKGVIETAMKQGFENLDEAQISNQIYGVSEQIKEKPEKAYDYTLKNNSVAVISEGSAVLGFGNIGTDAAMPVMEGKSALFKTLANIDAFPLCLKTQDSEEFIEIVSKLASVLGGINLEDISAPRCFEIEKQLIEKLNIPVFHDDQHGTAVVVLAGFLNALKLTGKNIKEVKVVMSGAGAAAQSVAKLLLQQGVHNLILSDSKGVVYKDRPVGMNEHLTQMAQITNPENIKGQLKDAINGADFVIGLSAAGVITPEMIKSMNKNPVVLALANPVPEIMPDIAMQSGAYIVATGRSDFKNQINNSLAFPGIFRGTLDVRAKIINNEMKLAAAKAIAGLIGEDELTPEYIIPYALDKRVVKAVSSAVSEAAIKTGVARI